MHKHPRHTNDSPLRWPLVWPKFAQCDEDSQSCQSGADSDSGRPLEPSAEEAEVKPLTSQSGGLTRTWGSGVKGSQGWRRLTSLNLGSLSLWRPVTRQTCLTMIYELTAFFFFLFFFGHDVTFVPGQLFHLARH